MKVLEERRGLSVALLQVLERLPVLSCYAKTHGWNYVVSWLHRLTGIGLVVYLGIHLYTLSSLSTPSVYDAKMRIMYLPIVVFLAWASSLMVAFHALNGGRLILYESFGNRNDETMIRWTFGLTVSYALLLGILMLMNNQNVSAVFFWLLTFFAGLATAYAVASRIWNTKHSAWWKLQRISGAFLVIAIPAHLVFSHLNPGMAQEAQAVIARMQNLFIRFVDLVLAAAALYHTGYGLYSIATDYVSAGAVRTALAVLIAVVVAVFGFLALKLTLFI
ncbi:MAG: Succinate dehydrogenase/Fumarate reductase transmembrane subunit [Syntrophaceae bacterium PtaU1.Bin231]|nr:MAG: Succinate dehydrogenase/Fumarate reductase transmembrane subunit [Syntrophaceae bacterium PtaU1.Bin231]HOG16395.1 succinate dehydrogenase, hydrophobic membrane anchor protein [Syntrophales bacterium]